MGDWLRPRKSVTKKQITARVKEVERQVLKEWEPNGKGTEEAWLQAKQMSKAAAAHHRALLESEVEKKAAS